MKDQLRILDAQILFAEQAIGKRQEQLSSLRARKASLYRDGGLLPLALMDEAERNKIIKMGTSATPCEYCGKIAVKKSPRRHICIECGHAQTHKHE